MSEETLKFNISHETSKMVIVKKEYDLSPKEPFKNELAKICKLFDIHDKEIEKYTLQLGDKFSGNYLNPDQVNETTFNNIKVLQ
jgi:hypothetical protein